MGKGGRRPYAWWRYEAVEWGLRGYAGYEHERSVLYETPGVLSELERSQLETKWRSEFLTTWREGFSYFKEGRIFTGEIARELHWLWADIPPELVDRWMAERERRGRTVCELQDQRGEAGSPLENERCAG